MTDGTTAAVILRDQDGTYYAFSREQFEQAHVDDAQQAVIDGHLNGNDTNGFRILAPAGLLVIPEGLRGLAKSEANHLGGTDAPSSPADGGFQRDRFVKA